MDMVCDLSLLLLTKVDYYKIVAVADTPIHQSLRVFVTFEIKHADNSCVHLHTAHEFSLFHLLMIWFSSYYHTTHKSFLSSKFSNGSLKHFPG